MDELHQSGAVVRTGTSSTKAAAHSAAALVVLLTLLVTGCGTSVFSAREPRQLSNAASSPEELMIRLIDATSRDDVPAIKNLRITKDEFCTYIWPELPGSKVPNVSCDFAWDQATLKSLSGLTRMLDQHRGRKYEFISLRFPGAPEHHESIVVHKAPTVSLRDEKGIVHEIRISGSILEMDGQFKLFGFVVD
jgi:hypothetical protein